MIDPLLKVYVQTRSADAFRALVDRYGKAVYAQCMRELRNPHLAEDVTQAVFMVLARKSASLPADVVLPAWLFKVTRFACANARRGEMRRKRHEQEAAMTRQLQEQASDDTASSDIEIAVDGALARLGQVDRNAIILRFYSDLNPAEVAQRLGMSAEATRRRISRALDKLRKMLTRTGVSVTPAVLLTEMMNLARTPAPSAELVERVVGHALHPTAATPWCVAVAKGTIHMMQWTKIKLGIAAALALAVTGAAGATAVKSIMDQPAPPAQVAAAAPTSAPAAEPAIDQELIRMTATRLAQAIRANDLKAIDQFMTVSDDFNGALAKGMVVENAAYRHLQDAWASKLKRPVRFTGFSFVWLPQVDGGMEVVLEKIVENLTDEDIQITGNTARFPMRLTPRGVKAAQSQNFLRGGWVALVNDGSSWKIDLSKTIRVNVTFTFEKGRQPTSSEQEMKIAIEQKRGVTEVLEATAQAIDSGKIGSADAAANKVETEVSALHRRLGLSGVNYNFSAAAPVSTEVGNP